MRFRHAKWIGNQSLKEVLLDLYAIAVDKDTSLKYYLECQNEGSTRPWNVSFFRDFNDWE